jgi:hypothetical protein
MCIGLEGKIKWLHIAKDAKRRYTGSISAIIAAGPYAAAA